MLFMKSKDLSTSSLSWDSHVLSLYKSNRPSKSILKIIDSGFTKIHDLLWILPLRVNIIPQISSFSSLKESTIFVGIGTIKSINISSSKTRKGKNGAPLFNVDAIIQDKMSRDYLDLKWFNVYPSLKKQLESYKEFTFMGEVSKYRDKYQIINPKINPKEVNVPGTTIVEYPTVNSVSGNLVSKIINKIPMSLWDKPLNSISKKYEEDLKVIDLNEAFKIIHGKSTKLSYDIAVDRLIYEEFFTNQLMILARKLKLKSNRVKPFINDNVSISSLSKFFPYTLTPDQVKACEQIRDDFKSGSLMMRLIQGDVGCGKTTVAFIAAAIILDINFQVAIMCPTETLAKQLHINFINTFNKKFNACLLTGSISSKKRKSIYDQLETGVINIVIGTHALFQDSVKFKSLKLAIIDEQHKFGVNQRLKLSKKGKDVHTLIMSATPIPRSLQLSQYGDLDISTIKSMPKGRKGISTRIVDNSTYDKFLSFIKTRVVINKEQVYVVVPGIEESETQQIENINELYRKYKKIFPELIVKTIHGQLSSIEKEEVMLDFKSNKINILISTTVIEVGVDIANSTVMAIYSPERFGLSSLHQLRGRVGRGEKPGFCFLVSEKKLSTQIMNRLKVLEKTTDGFEIAEADLYNRGEGDLFGSSQSGHNGSYRFASIVLHKHIFDQVTQDINFLEENKTHILSQDLNKLSQTQKVSSTI